jgi:hypothetical protein
MNKQYSETTMADQRTLTWTFVCQGLGLLLAALSFGCSNAAQPPEQTRAEQQVLTFPVRITLSTPNPVSPTEPVLVGSNSLSLGANSEIVSGKAVAMGSGGLQTQPDAVLNEVWSRGTAVLRDRVRLRGTLHARTRTLGNAVVVPTWDANPAFDPVKVLTWEVNYPTGAAPNFTLNQGQIGSIRPGRHGIVRLNSGSTLTLEPGTYYLTSLFIESNAVVRLDQARGPIVIYVTDALALRSPFVPVDGAEPRLMLGYLGTSPIVAETRFQGALIAPSATLTLRAVPSVHTGYFHAKDLVLEAGGRAKYGVPVGLVTAATPTGEACRKMLAGQVPDAELYRYCPGCLVPGDIDQDGVEDCVDDCDYDPLKVAPGACDCGVPDTDFDGDGTPDCQDDCDRDPHATSAGQCGCMSSDPSIPARKPDGTPCTDTGCPLSGTPTCSAGICGDRSFCEPAVGCRAVQSGRSTYWVCPGPATQAQAANACRSKNLALVRVDGHAENMFLSRLSPNPLWIGANSITTSGTWRWSTTAGNNGDQFWAGGATGSQRNALVSFWAKDAPGSQRCAVINSTGRWTAVDCNQALGYVCEFTAPERPGIITPAAGEPKQPLVAQTTCRNDSLLPPEDGGVGPLLHALSEADAGRFVGAAAHPPDGGTNTCLDDHEANAIGAPVDGGDDGEHEGCQFTVDTTQPEGGCFENIDCAAGRVCRQIKHDPACVPTEEVPCSARPLCGTLTCPPLDDTCDQVEVCSPGTDFTTQVTGLDAGVAPFNPADMFGGTLPPATPGDTFVDLPDGEGKEHTWCFMSPQQAVPNATQPRKDAPKEGSGGSSSPISFSFNPDLEFEANVNPLSLGETDLSLHARAELTTSVTLRNFLGIDELTKEILAAAADIRADRCSISTLGNDEHEGSKFEVFGHDFVDLTGIPLFDTADDLEAETAACNRAVGTFITAANRAKKAFRDAEQLLQQFEAAKDRNTTLKDLCNTLMRNAGPALDFLNFPDGRTCPVNEPPEVTINRFISYYQEPGFGQISQLKTAVQKLRGATDFLRASKEIQFGPKPQGESFTVAQAQFWIGPVPLVLEIDAFYSYGVAGRFNMELAFPYDPLSNATEQAKDIARVKAAVMPYANAGISAFVGAGVNLGPLRASVGIEGAVKLGDVKAPIFAGAGVGAQVTQDVRDFADDLNPLAQSLISATGLDNLTHFGRPKAMKFYVWFNYGAGLQVTDMLRGQINGRLRIRFAFFSRTWRKQIVKFSGMDPITIDFVNGKLGSDPAVGTDRGTIDYQGRDGTPATSSTNVVEGKRDVGYSEPQVPLLVLPMLEEPTEEFDPDAGDPFDDSDVKGFFYDSLCCAKLGEPVTQGVDQCLMPEDRAVRGGPVPCCAGLECQETAVGTRCRTPIQECLPADAPCASDGECCDVGDAEGVCNVNGVCAACGVEVSGVGTPCAENSDCCGGDLVPPLTYCDDEGSCRNTEGT